MWHDISILTLWHIIFFNGIYTINSISVKGTLLTWMRGKMNMCKHLTEIYKPVEHTLFNNKHTKKHSKQNVNNLRFVIFLNYNFNLKSELCYGVIMHAQIILLCFPKFQTQRNTTGVSWGKPNKQIVEDI